MKKKTIKVPFEVILRNKKTGEEIKIQDLNVPINLSVDKEKLHKIMQMNVDRENRDEEH